MHLLITETNRQELMVFKVEVICMNNIDGTFITGTIFFICH